MVESSPMQTCAIVPAYEAARTVGEVVRSLRQVGFEPQSTIVVDDGSHDTTAQEARAAGARVVSHPENRGKGVALRTGLALALAAGFDVAVTVDADGQHPASEAKKLVTVDADPGALVLGVRDLAAAGAPRANQLSNRFS